MAPHPDVLQAALTRIGICNGAADLARALHVQEDAAWDLADLYAQDNHRSLIDGLLPQGSLCHVRKLWSYDGACEVLDRQGLKTDWVDQKTNIRYRDLGNYTYAIAGRLLADYVSNSSLLGCHFGDSSFLSDVLIGDVFEAVFGYCYKCDSLEPCRQTAGVPALRCALEHYLWCTYDVVHVLQIHGLTWNEAGARRGSRSIARMLCL